MNRRQVTPHDISILGSSSLSSYTSQTILTSCWSTIRQFSPFFFFFRWLLFTVFQSIITIFNIHSDHCRTVQFQSSAHNPLFDSNHSIFFGCAINYDGDHPAVSAGIRPKKKEKCNKDKSEQQFEKFIVILSVDEWMPILYVFIRKKR